MALPALTFVDPPEPFATPWGETECDVHDKPGVVAFRDFVMTHQGGGYGSISRPCTGTKSGHWSGRAWDWLISANDPEQRQRADELIDWLLANDAEMFRRAGLRYIIWHKRHWSSLYREWRLYDGYAADGSCPSGQCRDPHTSHVHFSFGKPGADGQTSLFRAIGGTAPVPPAPNPFLPPRARLSYGWLALGFVAGLGAVVVAGRHAFGR